MDPDCEPIDKALAVGDMMLLQGTWSALDRRLNQAEVLVVNSPDLVRRQAVPPGQGAETVLVTLGIMVLLLATGLVPPALAGLIAAGIILTPSELWEGEPFEPKIVNLPDGTTA